LADLIHVYERAEFSIQEEPVDGIPTRLAAMRIGTKICIAGGHPISTGATQWVMFSLDALEHHAREILKAVEQARQWNPGERDGMKQLSDTMWRKAEGGN
jgi:hypothetical protein